MNIGKHVYKIVRLSNHQRSTIPHIVEWRGYKSEQEWLSAILETAIDIEFDSFYDEYPDWRVSPVYKTYRQKLYIALYLIAIILANLTIAQFGPSAAIVVAFLFIGLDLTARDGLHEAWKGKRLWLKMGLLIATGSILSWLLNREAGQIAVASFIAFASAGIVDTIVYHWLGKYPRWLRINGSNIPSAAVDSLVFPTLAFGGFMPLVTLGQFAAKVMGGFFWSLILRYR